MAEIERTPFSEFLNRKYDEWRIVRVKEGRHRISINAFAEWLDESQQIVSSWLNGRYTPSLEKAHNLAKVFGSEVYEVLGLDKPSELKLKIERMVDELSPEQQDEVLRYMEKLAAKETGHQEAH